MRDPVGIPQAMDSTGHTFGRKAIDDDPQPFTRPLRCGGCATTVNPVRGYSMRNTSTWVAAHYRLTSRDQAPHDEDCRYDFDAQAGRLHHEHRSDVTRDGGVFELRLPQTDPEAQARFTARWNGHRIPWKDFYFDTAHDASHLARTVEQYEHPVAVSGIVKRAGTTTKDSGYLIELDTERGVSHPPTKRWIHIRALSNDADRLNFRVGQRVLRYGQWTTYTPDQSINHYVHLWIDHRSLITAIDPPTRHISRGTP